MNEEDGLNFQDSIEVWPPFPDTISSLQILKRYFHLVAISNCNSLYLEQMSTSFGDPFDDMVSSDQVGVNKPDKRLFQEVLRRLEQRGICQNEILHVAQSQFHDIIPVSELGWSSVWIHRRHNHPGFGATPTPYSTVKPTLTTKSLGD